MKFRVSALFVASCALASVACGQWTTTHVDGSVQPREYGNTVFGTNQISNAATGQTWYMTWDSVNLYLGITNANLAEAAVIYVGTGSPGSAAGFNYDNTGFVSLPFPARFVAYVKDGYNEYRTSAGGSWSSQTANKLSYASNASNANTREFAIPWSAITGSAIPGQFNFFGYLTSASGDVYGQIPADNPSGFIGTRATCTQYFAVSNTGNGTSTPPFSDEESDASFTSSDMAGFLHNTFDPFYRSSEGAIPENTQVTLRFRTLHATGASAVSLRSYLLDTGTGVTSGPVDTPMPFDQNITAGNTEYDVWKATVTTPAAATIYYYKFEITKNGATEWYSDDYLDDYDNLNKDGTGAPSGTEPFDSFQITVYNPTFQTPAWMTTANVYQIFPDRFRNGTSTNDYCISGSSAGCPSFYGAAPSSIIAVNPWNSLLCDPNNAGSGCYQNFGSVFYGGDLLGIQNELDYIQGIGFDTLYLTPIFEASSNHRYDTDDFLTIDPALGGNSAFSSLIAEINRRGMRVILDGVFNHASSDSTYFNRYSRFPDVGACQSLSSPYRTWFHFNDSNVPCNSADYPGWDGVDTLPEIDHTQTAVQSFFYRDPVNSVMAHWYAAGASGWRFDVAPDPNFPHQWWVNTRNAAKSYKSDGPLIGEIWPNASPWLAGDQLDSTMNYRFRRNVTGFARGQYGWIDNNDNGNDSILPLTPSQFDTANRAVRDDYPPQASAAMLNLIDSHDTNRALYVLTEEGDSGLTQAKERLELAALFQFTYIGAPTVFYGDEAGMNAPSRYSGSNGPVGDPYARAPYPWTDQPGDPTVYGPPDQNVIAFYTRLAHMRKQYPALSSGTFVTLLTGDTQQPSNAPNTYAYARVGTNQTAVVALNNGSATNTPQLPVSAYFPNGTTLQDALTGSTYTVSNGVVSPALNPISGVVLLKYPASVDVSAPVASLTLHTVPNASGSTNTVPVVAQISASDGANGSGVNQIRYWVDNGPPTLVMGTTAQVSLTTAGHHTISARAFDNAGNISPLVTAATNINPAVAAVQ
jgi:glycosidase